MGSRLLWGLATATILLQTCSVCWCKVTVSVKFISFWNPNGKDHEGKDCDPRILVAPGGCDHYFQICIARNTRYSPIPANWLTGCDYRYIKTGAYHGKNENRFEHHLGTVANPIDVDIGDSETGLTVRVRVMDYDDGHRGASDVVDYLEFEYLIEKDNGIFSRRDSAEPFRQLIPGRRSTTEPTSLTIDFSAFCADDFYMYQGWCKKYCKQSRSPYFGQYSCTDDGDKRCFEGWKGESTNCTTKDQANSLDPGELASQQGNASNDNKGLIIGVVLGIFLLILIVVIIIALVVRERKQMKLKEQGTNAVVSTTTMGLQTNPGTTDMGTGGSYANPAFSSSNIYSQTDNNRNQRAAHGTQTANGHGPPPYKVADIATGGSDMFNNPSYGEQQVGGGNGSGSQDNVYDDVGLNKKY